MPQKTTEGQSPDYALLEKELTCSIGQIGSTAYEAGRSVWNRQARHRSPLAVIRPEGTQDVARSLRWAAKEGLRVSARSGGHSFDGFPVQPGTLLLDLSLLNGADLDNEGVAHVQPGARVQQLAEAFSPRSRALPTGDCGTVALGGLLSGGGFGYASRILGLTIDSVAEATIVTGGGDIIRASRNHQPDLFWAAVGGGGTAGIATEFLIRSFPVEKVTGFGLGFKWQSAREIVSIYQDLLTAAPAELDLKLKIRSTGPDRFLDENSGGPDGCTPGEPFVHVDGQFHGAKQDAETLLAPLLNNPALNQIVIREESYFEAMIDLIPVPSLNEAAPDNVRPLRVASDFVARKLSPDQIDAFVEFVEAVQFSPDFWGGCALLEPADKAVCSRAASDTAFPHRDTFLLAQWEVIHPVEVTDDEMTRIDHLLGRLRTRLSSALTGGRYLNYADRLDTPQNWWGENTNRLAETAATYDPNRTLVSRLHPL
jgi:FAD binding domain-containing protein